MSPSRKRAAVCELQAKFAVSERRACKTLNQPRMSQRYEPKPRDDEPKLAARMRELARGRPRFGYRRIGGSSPSVVVTVITCPMIRLLCSGSINLKQYPHGESNPGFRTENPTSWATRRWGP